MKSTKHILMILENSGFPEDTRVWMEACALVEKGYRVSLICPTGDCKKLIEDVGGVTVYRYPAPREFPGFWGYLFEYSYSLLCAFLLSVWIRLRHGFDAVHVHCPPDLNCVLAIFHQILGCKFVVDLHDLSPELYQAQNKNGGRPMVVKSLRFFETLACQYADALIATNQTQQKVQIERGGAMPQRCYIVRNGPNELFIQDGIQELPELRRDAETIIGYVGTMGVQDGVESLIRALHLLKAKRQDFHAYLVGNGTAVADLKQLTNELGLESHITFTGYVPFSKVPRYIATFDICTTPDPSNPYNDSCTTIKTMEYMALGRPTVAFRTPENELSAGNSALYADDLQQFAELLSLLADDPNLRQQMGEKGKRRVREQLAWKYQREVLLQLYSDLFSGRVRSVTRKSDRSTESPSVAAKPITQESTLASIELPVRFCFDGQLGEYLQQELERDMFSSELSTFFRLFYKVRSVVPSTVRQWAQARRNKALLADSRWYIPKGLESTIAKLEEPLVTIWPERAEYALVLTHDVEEQEGFDRVLTLAGIEERLGLSSCWNIVPYKYRIDLGIIRELQDRGHEVAVHGFNHDGRLFSSKQLFDSRVAGINQAAATWEARGFRAPMVHRKLHWMQALQVDYDSSCFDVDPFQAMPGGVENIWPFQIGRLVELPYTLPQDHTLFITLKESSTRVWRDKLAFIRRHHGMALMLTHPDYLCSSELLNLYEQFLQDALSQSQPWKVLPGQLATWFRQSTINSGRGLTCRNQDNSTINLESCPPSRSN